MSERALSPGRPLSASKLTRSSLQSAATLNAQAIKLTPEGSNVHARVPLKHNNVRAEESERQMIALSSTPQMFTSNSLGVNNFFSSDFAEIPRAQALTLNHRIMSAGAARRDETVSYRADGQRDRGMSAKARLSTSPVSRLSSSSSRPASALRSPSPSSPARSRPASAILQSVLAVAGEFSRPSTANLQNSLRATVKASPLIRPKSPEPSSLLKAQFQAEELTYGLQELSFAALARNLERTSVPRPTTPAERREKKYSTHISVTEKLRPYDPFADSNLTGYYSNKDVEPIMKAVGYVKKDWLESPLLGNLKREVANELAAMSPPRSIRNTIKGAVQDNQALGDVYHRLDVDVNDDAVLEPQHVQLFWDFAAIQARLTWNGSSSETPDLDIVALIFDKFGFVLDCCFWGHKSTGGNALVHSGDCRPAAAAGGGAAAASQSTPAFNGRNEESIVIDIARLPPHQHSVALCVVSASGHPLGAANAAEVTLTAFPAFSNPPSSATNSAASPSKRRPITPNALSGTPVRRSEQQGKTVGVFSLTAATATSAALCFITRSATGWQLAPLNVVSQDTSYLNMVPRIELMLLQLGVSERPYIVVEACCAQRPTPSLRGSSEQYQNVQRDVVAAASSLLPRAHVVVNREPRKGALEVDLYVPTPSGNKRFNLHSKMRSGQWPGDLEAIMRTAAEHLESVRPLPVEIDARSPVRFEVRSTHGNKPVKGVVLQVVPGGEDFSVSNGYRLRFDCEISVKLQSNVYAVICSALGYENPEPKLFRVVSGSKDSFVVTLLLKPDETGIGDWLAA